MSYVIKAVLRNARHPEYGQDTVPFPVPNEEYDGTIALLSSLGIGDAVCRDCQIDDLDSFYTVLNRMLRTSVTFDELDYLAKRLDSFDDGEAARFQGMAHKLGLSNIKDLINLTFCCQQATVITDFSDLGKIGQEHYMDLNGGCASVQELENLDGVETALLLVVPAKPELAQERAVKRQIRVAAYCRVSTDGEEQLTSYEAQQNYYTDKIMTNPDWTMAGIFADEGITGTSAKKRPEFLKMIRKCRQKKIDLVLVKSISRFARNTVDCLNYIRALRELGIAVIFEKENINTLESDSEMLITMMGAFAQAESESISQNVRWGKRQAMRESKTIFQYKRLYAFEKGEAGKPKIIPEQAEVVRRIYDSFLAGHSMRMIKETLERDGIQTVKGNTEWSISVIRGILTNEKYCGDALQQKRFTSDCISRKHIRNTGQLPMYLVPDHHEAIVSRDTYNAVQAELARRNAGRAPSRNKAPTGRSCYSAKYALTERLVCGNCGTLYRRCAWTKRGKKRVVWRCASRVDYGTRYCKESPALDEQPLQGAILAAINSAMSQKETLIGQIIDAMRMELAPIPGESMSLSDIDRRIKELEKEFQTLFAEARENGGYLKYADQFKRITDDAAALKEKRVLLLEQQQADSAANRRISDAVGILSAGSPEIAAWDESMIRQLVDTVKVLSANKIRVCLRGGMEIEQTVEEAQVKWCS